MTHNSKTHAKSKGLIDIKALNRFVSLLSVVKVPLLGLCRPKVIELTASQAKVMIPLKWLTKNHLGSMYFGALAMGAELSIALQVLQRIQQDKAPVSFVFKDFNCKFRKRADTDVFFQCADVGAINALIEQALGGAERVEGHFLGTAFSTRDSQNIFMEYGLTISLKKSDRKF